MRQFLVLILSLCGAVHLMAQSAAEKEQVYIKYYDGSIFIGDVVGREAYSMRVRIATQDTINVQYGLIRRMHSSRDLIIFHGGKYQLKTGWYGIMTFGAGGNSDDSYTAQWDVTAAYRLKEDLHVGLGLGLEGGDIQVAGFWYFQNFTSIYGYTRYYPLPTTKIRPYFDGKLGVGIPRDQWDGEHTGGVLVQPGIGVEFASRNNFRFIISVSQYLQNTSGESAEFGPFSQPVQSTYNVWYNRTVFKLGLQFK